MWYQGFTCVHPTSCDVLMSYIIIKTPSSPAPPYFRWERGLAPPLVEPKRKKSTLVTPGQPCSVALMTKIPEPYPVANLENTEKERRREKRRRERRRETGRDGATGRSRRRGAYEREREITRGVEKERETETDKEREKHPVSLPQNCHITVIAHCHNRRGGRRGTPPPLTRPGLRWPCCRR